jgi:hypothetical protein
MQLSSVRIRNQVTGLILATAAWGYAQDAGTLTLLRDTPLRVIRGVSVLNGVEGMRIRQGDVFETGPAPTAQAQLEFASGAIVELGPGSQVFLISQAGASSEIVLLAGWLKGETESGNYRYATSLVSVTTKGGNVLLHNDKDTTDVFIERGIAAVSAGTQAPITSSTGHIFFTRRGGKPLVAQGRPSADFVTAMPVSFRDALPSRLSRFAGLKPPEPRKDHDVSYSEVERLLTLPPAWRRGLAERFRSRLEDPAFRKAIEAHLAALPDWKPILYASSYHSTPTDPR